MTEPETNHGPPAPRLLPGHLLPNDWEIDRLIDSDECKNLYQVRGKNGIAYLLETADDGEWQQMPDQVNHLFPSHKASFRYRDRAYVVFDVPKGRSLSEGCWLAWEPDITAWLVRVAEALSFLDDMQLDLSRCRPNDLYIDGDQLQILMPLARRRGENDRAGLLRQITRRVLFHKLIPKVTRNLTTPLSCLCFSKEVEVLLASILGDYGDTWQALSALRSLEDGTSADWEIAAACDTGRLREANEDACGWSQAWVQTSDGRQQAALFAVSDGMGGHMLGEVASREVLRRWMGMMQSRLVFGNDDWSNPHIANTMSAILDELADIIYRLDAFNITQGFADHLHPGATLVGGLLVNRLLFLGHCGDSRAYLLTDQGLSRLTKDHSLVQLYIDRGQLTSEEAFHHVNGNVITSFMGIDPKSFKRDVTVRRLLPGARLLFASDGLFDMVRDEDIAQILAGPGTADDIAHQLIAAANRAGGEDNISVVVAMDRQGAPPHLSTHASDAEYGDTNSDDASVQDPGDRVGNSQTTNAANQSHAADGKGRNPVDPVSGEEET